MQAGLKKQWVLFCYSLSFFSRSPIPQTINFTAFPFHLGNAYFPLIGTLSAIISFGVYYFAQLFFDPTISILLMLTAGLLFTGGLHEDGFADCCDGFGGGYSKAQCLAIMKDSQIGTYGVLGLIILLALKVHLFIDLSSQSNLTLLGVLLSAAMLSRLSVLLVIQYDQYAREGVSKASNSSHKLPKHYFVLTIIFSLCSLYWMPLTWGAGILIALAVSTSLCRIYFKRQIGGYTGDCLGFLQQLNELLILLILVYLFQ